MTLMLRQRDFEAQNNMHGIANERWGSPLFKLFDITRWQEIGVYEPKLESRRISSFKWKNPSLPLKKKEICKKEKH